MCWRVVGRSDSGGLRREDLFQMLPIHWMWWPAIGGLVIGVGGLIFPQALGVGYDTIGTLLQGDVPTQHYRWDSAGEVGHLGGSLGSVLRAACSRRY